METWKTISDYNYSVSSEGRIRNDKTIKILKSILSNDNYYQITLYKNGNKKNYRIARLVSEAFILNPENKPGINHKDLNKRNNYIENLEWCTQLENVNHAIANGHRSTSEFKKGHKLCVGERHPSAKLNYEKVSQIRKLYKTGDCTELELAKIYSMTQAGISLVIKNKTWKQESKCSIPN